MVVCPQSPPLREVRDLLVDRGAFSAAFFVVPLVRRLAGLFAVDLAVVALDRDGDFAVDFAVDFVALRCVVDRVRVLGRVVVFFWGCVFWSGWAVWWVAVLAPDLSARRSASDVACSPKTAAVCCTVFNVTSETVFVILLTWGATLCRTVCRACPVVRATDLATSGHIPLAASITVPAACVSSSPAFCADCLRSSVNAMSSPLRLFCNHVCDHAASVVCRFCS